MWFILRAALWLYYSGFASAQPGCHAVMKVSTVRQILPGSFLYIKARVRNTAKSPQTASMSVGLPRGFKFMDAKPNGKKIKVVDNLDGGQTVYWIDMTIKRVRTLRIKAYVLRCLLPGSYQFAGATFQIGSHMCLTHASNSTVRASHKQWRILLGMLCSFQPRFTNFIDTCRSTSSLRADRRNQASASLG